MGETDINIWQVKGQRFALVISEKAFQPMQWCVLILHFVVLKWIYDKKSVLSNY